MLSYRDSPGGLRPCPMRCRCDRGCLRRRRRLPKQRGRRSRWCRRASRVPGSRGTPAKERMKAFVWKLIGTIGRVLARTRASIDSKSGPHLVVVFRVVVHAGGAHARREQPVRGGHGDGQRRRTQVRPDRATSSADGRRRADQRRGGVRVGGPAPAARLQRPGAVHPVPLGGARSAKEGAVIALKIKIRTCSCLIHTRFGTVRKFVRHKLL